MTDPPRIYDPPRNPPLPPRALITGAVSSLIALILLLLGYTTAGIVFVGLAFIANVAGVLAGGSSSPGARGQAPPKPGGPQGPAAAG
jgi:hypothetical protein